ncbi:hypothetical protein AN639_10695 [Candidatus Epulonipiscium fishelsonii]|uniref:Uncharacterized protein n=1 Tax=Candidatus Epulonipiscium fishelsonii TaxID=77094 RepID=A0ACC8XF46_9FIRM|nr:hypothetical protein AN396_00450 [Epulopiscium sp. SCG-B11WGA-EpuloA1]ONI43271.1 hypothetical protein AN639_10695 [Epulopiscium sp. SCG-B05WGA-EpuloA1]
MDKNKVNVVIGDQVYTIQGDESSEHIERAAFIVNNKIKEIEQSLKGKFMDSSKSAILVAMNIANDYLKTQMALEKCTNENKILLQQIEKLEKIKVTP